eukprot:9116950-Alexandrium_andersonii.AAC.1
MGQPTKGQAPEGGAHGTARANTHTHAHKREKGNPLPWDQAATINAYPGINPWKREREDGATHTHTHTNGEQTARRAAA